jgi:hypothetical protein
MWWRAGVFIAVVLAGCTRPNLLFAPTVAGDGGAPDKGAAETGTEVPVAEAAADGADDMVTVEVTAEVPVEAPPADGTEAPPGGSDAVDVAPVVDTRDTSPPAEVTLPSSLIGHWRLDERGGIEAKDSSLDGFDGDLEGITAANWESTARGGGLRFDRGPGDGVRVGEVNAVPSKIQTLTEFTIAAWTFRAVGSTGYHQTIISRQLTGNTEVFSLAFDNQFLKFYIYPQIAGDTLMASAELTTGRAGGDWVHVAATYDGSQMRVYLDGVPAGIPVAYTGMLRASQFPLYIGTNKNDPAEHQPFDGILDEVMLFSQALGVDAIGKLRDGDLTGL